MIISEISELSILDGLNLKLFSYRPSHSVIEFIVEKEGMNKWILSFMVTKYINTPVRLTKVKINLLHNKNKIKSSEILLEQRNSKSFVIDSVEGEFLIIADVVSINDFDNDNKWAKESLSIKLARGFPSPLEIKEIKEIINKT